MGEMHLVSESRSGSAAPLTFAQQEVLERAVAKVVLLGELVGVSTDQMILLLNSGLTVSELLEYLGLRTQQVALNTPRLEVCSKKPAGE